MSRRSKFGFGADVNNIAMAVLMLVVLGLTIAVFVKVNKEKYQNEECGGPNDTVIQWNGHNSCIQRVTEDCRGTVKLAYQGAREFCQKSMESDGVSNDTLMAQCLNKVLPSVLQ